MNEVCYEERFEYTKDQAAFLKRCWERNRHLSGCLAEYLETYPTTDTRYITWCVLSLLQDIIDGKDNQ